jgi:hypothetical protein
MINDGRARSDACGDLSRQGALVLACYGTPKHDLTPPHDDADFRGVDFAMVMHLLLDARPHLRVRWGNLAHSRSVIGRVHELNSAIHVPTGCAN